MIKEGIKQGTSWLQQKDERLEGDEPQIEENPEAEEEEPRLAGRDGLDQGPAQLPAEAEEQARAEEEEKARRILEETELKSFRLALPMRTKTSREVTSTVMEMWLKLRADGHHVGRQRPRAPRSLHSMGQSPRHTPVTNFR